jgi:prefoldin subunit 5
VLIPVGSWPTGINCFPVVNNLEAIHQQMEKRREKMLRLSELQKKIDDVIEEIRNIAQHTEHHEQLYNYRDL